MSISVGYGSNQLYSNLMPFWHVPGFNEKKHERAQILNQGPFEYEAAVLPTRQRRSGLWHKWIKKQCVSWPGFEASSFCCQRVESLPECLVVVRPVLSTEYLNGNSRRDTRVVKVPAVRR
jgi:hypothetical protein